MRTVVLARDLKVTVWQWPKLRSLWAKHLPKGSKVEVVAVEPDRTMVCRLERDNYFVLWPASGCDERERNQKEMFSSLSEP